MPKKPDPASKFVWKPSDITVKPPKKPAKKPAKKQGGAGRASALL